ncbi:hypothetical protein L6452_01621 [Arctium lappa]|uniref:Uncharacterized protein n=1 Tax=Arctium lappa TaxID=4217 RepID=A0ACB9FIN4_ARCLA|nr:hypothetical protein L6452_01621 [Arctium lappa]
MGPKHSCTSSSRAPPRPDLTTERIARRDARRILLLVIRVISVVPSTWMGWLIFVLLRPLPPLGWKSFSLFTVKSPMTLFLSSMLGTTMMILLNVSPFSSMTLITTLTWINLLTLLGLPLSDHRVFTNATSFSPLLPQVEPIPGPTPLNNLSMCRMRVQPGPSRRCHNHIPDPIDEDAPLPSTSSSSRHVFNRVINNAVLGLQQSQNSFQRV